jgi:hypothetical protein
MFGKERGDRKESCLTPFTLPLGSSGPFFARQVAQIAQGDIPSVSPGLSSPAERIGDLLGRSLSFWAEIAAFLGSALTLKRLLLTLSLCLLLYKVL